MDHTSVCSVCVRLGVKDLYIFKVIEAYSNTTYQFFGAMCILSLLMLPFTGLPVYKLSNSILLPIFIRIILPLIYLLIPLSEYFELKKQFNNIKRLSQESTYFISNFGIECESHSSNSRWNWSEIERYSETKWNIAIFVSKKEALLIPKRCFSSNEQLETLKEFFKAKSIKEKK